MSALTRLDLSTVKTSGGILIRTAADLVSFSFRDLTVVNGELRITSNPRLNSVAGIPCGLRITGNLEITFNPSLSNAAALAKANCLIVSGRKDISNNGNP